MKVAHLKIQGIVQGVWYRAGTRDEADRLGVSGWVRNAPDGSVEAFVQGPAEVVDRLIEWCRRGPAGARVDRVDLSPAAAEPGLQGFSIHR